MSVQATSAVWDHSEARGADLILMLAVADAANADGRNSHPGMPRLTHDCRKDKRAVLQSIERCIERGELVRVETGHRGRAATFDLVLPGLEAFEERVHESASFSESERVKEIGGKGAGKEAIGRTPRAPLPNNQEPLRRSTKSKTQTLRQWEAEGCPELHCNRLTAFCTHCARERRELVA